MMTKLATQGCSGLGTNESPSAPASVMQENPGMLQHVREARAEGGAGPFRSQEEVFFSRGVIHNQMSLINIVPGNNSWPPPPRRTMGVTRYAFRITPLQEKYHVWLSFWAGEVNLS